MLYLGRDTHDLGCWVHNGDFWYRPEYRDHIRQCASVIGPPEFWECREGYVLFDKCAAEDCAVMVEPSRRATPAKQESEQCRIG